MRIKFSFIAIALLTSFIANAQIKIGYVNVDYVLAQMPEAKQIDADLKAYEKQLNGQLQSKVDDFEAKMADYQSGAAAMTELVRVDKEQELQTLQESIRKFQLNAEQSLQEKQVELLQPAYDKIQATIDLVADEKGYAYIFNSRPGGLAVLLYAPEGDDISLGILKKMGVTIEE